MIIEQYLWKRVFQIRYRRQTLYETFSLRPKRKIVFRQKKIRTRFLSLNCVQTSMGVLFGYRRSLERIRSFRILNIYYFRQVHLESVKNVMSLRGEQIDSLTGTFSFFSLNIIQNVALAVRAT